VTHFQEVVSSSISPKLSSVDLTASQAFVFDNTAGYGYDALHSSVNPFATKPQSYYDLATLMSSSWISFIYDLNPNNFTGRYAAAEPWPKYSLETPQNIVWDANETALAVVEKDDYREEGIAFILGHAMDFMR
jgi:hypothetical protein